MRPDPALEPTLASALCVLAEPSALCASVAGEGERWAPREGD